MDTPSEIHTPPMKSLSQTFAVFPDAHTTRCDTHLTLNEIAAVIQTGTPLRELTQSVRAGRV